MPPQVVTECPAVCQITTLSVDSILALSLPAVAVLLEVTVYNDKNELLINERTFAVFYGFYIFPSVPERRAILNGVHNYKHG